MKRIYGQRDIALAFLAFLIMLLSLFAGGRVGLSDNGDFARVMNINSIAYAEGTQKAFVYNDRYIMSPQGDTYAGKLKDLLFGGGDMSEYPSVHHFFVRVSELINLAYNIVSGSALNVFRLSFLGILMSAIYALLLYVLFRLIRFKGPWDLIIKLVIIIILCDIGYIAYFNSFYSEPVQILALLCVAVTCIRVLKMPELRTLDIILLMAALIFYGWSKFINIPISMLGLVFFLYPVIKKTRPGRKKYAAAISGLAFFLLIIIYASVPKWMDYQTNYNSVFFGILKDTDSAECEKYLEELGLPSYMLALKNSNYYMEEILPVAGTQRFKDDFASVRKGDILEFYLKNPGHLFKKLDISIKNSGFIRPFYLGNYDGSHERASLSNKFSLWSNVRKTAPFNKAWANILIAAAFILVFLSLFREYGLKGSIKTGLFSLFLFFGAASLYSLILPVVSNGEGDIAKHMFAYAQLIDYMLIVFLYLAVKEAVKLKKINMKSLTAIALLAAFAAPVFFNMLSGSANRGQASGNIGPGSYVNFGTFENKPIKWLVLRENEDSFTLIAADCIIKMSFSSEGEYGSNLWTKSDIRKWLNGPFLDLFSHSERDKLIYSENRYILSSAYKKLSVSGERPFFCFHIPELCARGADEAYGAFCRDYAFLPDVDDIKELISLGVNIARGIPYWLETPYYSNGSMVRTVDFDGYVYMRDANTEKGVLPMIAVKKEALK